MIASLSGGTFLSTMENATIGFVHYGTEEYSGDLDIQNLTTNDTSSKCKYLLECYPQSLLCFGAISCIVFAVIGVPGNFLTILALLRTPRLRNATSAFVINLCVADGFYSGFSLPMAAATFLKRGWPYGDDLCKAYAMIRYMNGALCLLTIAGITINRYVLILHPRHYTKLCTTFSIGLFITSLWIIAFLTLLPTATGLWGSFQFDPEVGTCTIVKVDGKSPKVLLYSLAFTLPTIIFIFCYSRIFFVVRKAQNNLRRASGLNMEGSKRRKFSHLKLGGRTKWELSKDLKLLRIIMVIFLSFIICYVPVSIVKVFQKEKSLPALNVMGYLGVHFYACINPIIYVVMSKEYRTAYKSLFFCSTPKDVYSGSSQTDTSNATKL